ADFDNDGKIDVVVSALGEPAELWQNVSPDANHWLVVKLTGTRSNRDGIGAKIRLGNQSNHVTTAVGYASSSPSTVHFGTGRLEKIDRVEIRWPSGTVQMLRNVATNQVRSEEHTSELQSRGHLVCRLLLEKKNITHNAITMHQMLNLQLN